MTAPLDLDAIRRYYNGRGGWQARKDVRALCDEVERLRAVADAARNMRRHGGLHVVGAERLAVSLDALDAGR